jgi:predicted transcriptional regulator
MKTLSIIVAVAVISFPLLAQTSKIDRLKPLEAAVQKEVDQKKKEHPSDDVFPRGSRAAMLTQLRAVMLRGDDAQIEETLNQMLAYFESDEVRNEVERLLVEFRKEREAKDAAQVTKLETAFQHAAEVVKTAKQASDLDDALQELAKFRDMRNHSYTAPALQAAVSRLQAVTQFVTHWQDYLAADAQGNSDAARQALQNAANLAETDAGLMPRSEILSRLQKFSAKPSPSPAERSSASKLEEIMARTKTLDDISQSLRELRMLQGQQHSPFGSSDMSDPLNATVNSLAVLDKTYHEYLAGLPTTVAMASSSNEAMASAAVVPLRLQLLMLVLPRYLGVSDDLKPKQGEAVQPFLERVVEEARKRGDVGLMERANDALRTLVRGGGAASTDTSALALFTAGQNQETAGQFSLAVVSYQNALKSGSQLVPAKLIGERLAAIQKEHPKEFETGMDRFQNPPVSNYSYPGALPPSMRGQRSYPPNMEPQSQPALAIPGGSPASKPAGSPTATPTPSASSTPTKEEKSPAGPKN